MVMVMASLPLASGLSISSLHSFPTKNSRYAKQRNGNCRFGIPAQNTVVYMVLDSQQEHVKESTNPMQDIANAGSTDEDKQDSSTKMDEDMLSTIKLLKTAAKTRSIPSSEIISAFNVLRKAKLEPSTFLQVLGGNQSPGRKWRLMFTSQGKAQKGFYFPVTAVQRFDTAAMRIENGIYLGPVGSLTFDGRFSWRKRILAFIFENINLKIGPFGPLKFSLVKKGDENRDPSTKDPFFIWFYVDEEIAVAQGRGGGIALWHRFNGAV